MSSNIRIQKVCLECKRGFIARTTVTKFCNKLCNSRYYKREQRNNFLDAALQKEREQRLLTGHFPSSRKGRPRKSLPPVIDFNSSQTNPLIRELLDIRELAVVVGISERSLYRLLKDEKFPKLRIGKRILFNKSTVVNYLTQKYANQ